MLLIGYFNCAVLQPGLGSNTFYQIQIQIQIHFFPEFQIQIQIQIHRQKSDQIQIQIQIQLIKYKYKYKYTMRPRQNCRHFTDDILKFIVLLEDCLYIQISLKIVSKGPIYKKPTLVQIMAWCWVGNKPLSDQWWPDLLMHKCITRPKWVNRKCSVADCYLNVVYPQSWGNSVKPVETKTCSRSVTHFITCLGNIFDQRATLSLLCIAWIKQFLYALNNYQFPEWKLMMMGNFLCMC